MADTSVAITAGTGTAIDTRTEATNGNHRQVMVLGDPSTNAGVAPVDATNGLSVTLTTALPAGTAAIGKLAANAGVTIGAVEVAAAQTLGAVTTVGTVTTVSTVTNVAAIGTSVTPGTSAAHLGKAEDAAHGSGDTGVMALAVRNDAGTALAGTTGDYIPLSTDANGALRVSGASGTTQYAEDAAHVSGDSGVLVLGVRSDTVPTSTSGTAGDYSGLNLDANGRVYVNAALYTAAGAALTTDTQGTHDTALGTITSVTAGLTMGRASASAPSAISADDDAVLAWYTRSGQQVVTPTPNTTTGLSTFMASGSDGSSILVATAQVIKASAGQLYGYYLYNPEAAVTFVHFYNTAQASVTVGTTNPLFTIPVPAGAAANLMFNHGVTFSNTGWSCAATTTAGGNTAPSTGVSAVIWYA